MQPLLMPALAATLLMATLGSTPAPAWQAGPDAGHATRVPTIQPHQNICADGLVSPSRMTPDGLTVTVCDFGPRTHDLWDWPVVEGRHFAALPLASQSLGALAGPQATVDRSGVRLAGLQPDPHDTLIIDSPDLAGVDSHTAPLERRRFRSARASASWGSAGPPDRARPGALHPQPQGDPP